MDVSHEMKVAYYKRRLDDYAGCLKAIEEKKSKFIETVGHQIKGHAAPYGFADLAVIGNDLEVAAKSENWQKITAAVQSFGNYLSQHELR